MRPEPRKHLHCGVYNPVGADYLGKLGFKLFDINVITYFPDILN